MSEQDGGPACRINPQDWEPTRANMTLRDYFAGQALVGLVGKTPLLKDRDPRDVLPSVPLVTEEDGGEIRKGVAECAYRYADAMLKARQV